MSIAITPIIVPPRTPALQPQAFIEPSWTHGKRSREGEYDTFEDPKRPRICPSLADTLALLASYASSTELYATSVPSSSTGANTHPENNSEMSGPHLADMTPEGVLGSSDPPVGQTTLSPEEYYKFESEDDLLAWVLSLPGIDDELSEEDSSPSASDVSASPSASDVSASPSGTSDASASPHLPPPPIFAAQDDRINTVPTGAQLPHSIPRPARCAHIVRGPTRRTVDTEDLRKDVVNNRRRHWYFAEDTAAFPTLYERDLPPCDTPGTPPRNIDERMKLEPLASAYKYTLDPDRTTSLATCRDYSSSEDEGANGYSATELFGPDAETVKVARCAPVRPRASIDLCELTTVEHTLRHRTGKTTEPSSRLKMYADPCAVEYWKASVNEVVEYVRAEKAKEERARLAAELAAFFEDAAAGDDDDDEDDDDEGMKAVEIPDLKEEAEADALFDAENDSDGTGSESSNEEDGRLFDFDQWVADCLLL